MSEGRCLSELGNLHADTIYFYFVRMLWMHDLSCDSVTCCLLTMHDAMMDVQFDLSYPAMSGPVLIRIRDLAGYGRLNV